MTPYLTSTFSWKKGEPKRKPFTIVNAGGEEAREIQIHPIRLGKHQVTFPVVGQLVPESDPVEIHPKIEHAAYLFATLVDDIDRAIRERQGELKAEFTQAASFVKDIEQHAGAESKANDEFAEIPVIVTYLNRKQVRTTLEYKLATYAFAEVETVELQFVAER